MFSNITNKKIIYSHQYTTKHKLHTARTTTIGLFGFCYLVYYCCYFYDQHTNKRKQRIKVERHEEKTSSIQDGLNNGLTES
jgi:hypothetical protein